MIVVDPHYKDWSRHSTTEYNMWTEFCPDAEEALPDEMLTLQDKGIIITVYVDADHAHNKVTRQLVMGTVS